MGRGRESEERYGYLEHGNAVDHESPNLSSGPSYLLYRRLVENNVGCRYLLFCPFSSLSILLPLSHIPKLILSAFWRKTSISDSLSRMRETALLTRYWMSGNPMHVVISGWLGLLVTFTCEREEEIREKEIISLCECWISFCFIFCCYYFVFVLIFVVIQIFVKYLHSLQTEPHLGDVFVICRALVFVQVVLKC